MGLRFRLLPRFLRRLASGEAGSAAIDFAFAAPVLVLATVGMVDLARIAYVKSTIGHAAHEAARYAALHGASADTVATEEDVRTRFLDHATGVKAADVSVAVTWAPDNDSGSAVSVQADYAYPLMLGGFLPLTEITLRGNAALRVM